MRISRCLSLSFPSSLTESFSSFPRSSPPPLIKVKDKDSKWWQLWHHIHYNAISSSPSPPLLFNSPILVIKIGRFSHNPPDHSPFLLPFFLCPLFISLENKVSMNVLVFFASASSKLKQYLSIFRLLWEHCPRHLSHDSWTDPWKLSHLTPPVFKPAHKTTLILRLSLYMFMCLIMCICLHF